MYKLSYSPCNDYEYDNVRAALEDSLSRVTDFSWLHEGMMVAIKVNLIMGIKPHKAATTHPAVVCALCDILREKGAKVIVGDSPGGLYNAAWVEKIYSLCGMNEAESHGAELNRDYSEAHIKDENAKLCREFDCTAYLTKADAIIDLCKLKTHGMMTLTAGVKNMFGAIPGAKKPEYHFRYPNHGDFAEALIDIYEHFSPVLTICDAVTAMEGNGPTAGSPRHVGYIAVSDNAHVLDESLARLIGLEPMAVPTLAAAKARGLLPEKAEIYGQPETIADYDIPDNRGILFEGKGSFMGNLRSKLFSRVLTVRPMLEKEKCVGCRECEKVCPAKAIVMADGKPRIDRKKCIRCFCCQEFCPRGALYAGRSALAGLINKEVR